MYLEVEECLFEARHVAGVVKSDYDRQLLFGTVRCDGALNLLVFCVQQQRRSKR